MFGKLLGAFIGQKIGENSGRGASGALLGAGAVAVARRVSPPIAILFAASYGIKKLRDYRRSQGTAA